MGEPTGEIGGIEGEAFFTRVWGGRKRAEGEIPTRGEKESTRLMPNTGAAFTTSKEAVWKEKGDSAIWEKERPS